MLPAPIASRVKSELLRVASSKRELAKLASLARELVRGDADAARALLIVATVLEKVAEDELKAGQG